MLNLRVLLQRAAVAGEDQANDQRSLPAEDQPFEVPAGWPVPSEEPANHFERLRVLSSSRAESLSGLQLQPL